MNSSGMLYTDAGLVVVLVYAFWGGWLVTLAGVALSIAVLRQPGRRDLGVALAAGCLAPLAYEMLWVWLARSGWEQPQTSDLATCLVMVGLAISVFGAPAWALVCVLRAPRVRTASS